MQVTVTILSQREKDILRLMAEYRTYAYIGYALGISLKTVYNNICTLMAKIGVHKKEHLIQYAQEHGFSKQEVAI